MRFPVSVKCYRKKRHNFTRECVKQFAIIPLRTFKCKKQKKRMFSSSADVHHMPKYPVHLKVPKVVDPLIPIGHFLSTSVTRSLRGKQLQFTSHECLRYCCHVYVRIFTTFHVRISLLQLNFRCRALDLNSYSRE